MSAGSWAIFGIYFTSMWLDLAYCIKRDKLLAHLRVDDPTEKPKTIKQKIAEIDTSTRKFVLVNKIEKSDYEKKIENEIDAEIKNFEKIRDELINRK